MVYLNFLIFVQLFAVFVATQAGGGRGFGGPNHGPGGGGPNWGQGGNGNGCSYLFCNNATLGSSFLTQIQQLITTLQSNGSFTQVLSAHANAIAYLTNSANTALLSSNCTAFCSGLQAAKQADQAAGQVQQQYARSAGQAVSQIIQSLYGGKGRGDSDSDELF